MKAIELLGLPGSGKTYLLKSSSGHFVKYGCEVDVNIVELRSKFKKIINSLQGLVRHLDLMPFLFNVLYHAPVTRKISILRNVIILFERLANTINSNRCVDEGVIQALWGILYRTGIIRDCEIQLALRVIKLINKESIIFYLNSPRDKHLKRYFSREAGRDYFNFCAEKNYMHARKVMAMLLIICRKQELSLVRVRS